MLALSLEGGLPTSYHLEVPILGRVRILGRGYDISEMIMNQVQTKHWKYPSIKIVQASQINIYNQMQLYIYA